MVRFANDMRFLSRWLRALETCRAELRLWGERARGRAQLARMTDAERRDIGKTATDVWVEVSKPRWRK